MMIKPILITVGVVIVLGLVIYGVMKVKQFIDLVFAGDLVSILIVIALLVWSVAGYKIYKKVKLK